MVFMDGECVCWCPIRDVLGLTSQFICTVDASARIVTLL